MESEEENSINMLVHPQFKFEDITPNSLNYFDEFQNNLFFFKNDEEEEQNKKKIDIIANIFPNKFSQIKIEGDNLNKPTNDQSQNSFTKTNNKIKEDKKYFKIIKMEKKTKPKLYKNLGRKKKNSSSEPSKHSKISDDNIRNKIITNFINSYRDNFNKKLSKFFKSKSKAKLIQKIAPINKVYQKIDEIKIFFRKTLGEIFSAEISDRCSTFKDNKNYNKKLIDDLRKNSKDVEINDLLNQTVQEMYIKYISNIIPEFNLDDDIKKIKIKENDKDYIDLYRIKAINLIQNINEKKGRQNKSNII